jgi:excisionase family DNA binding protein
MNRTTATFDDPQETWRATKAGANPVLADELLTVHDAARFLNVSASWIYEHTRENAEDRLPFLKLGKYVRFDRTDLREYVNAKRRAARAGHGRR